MENVAKVKTYFRTFLSEIDRKDPLHANTLKKGMEAMARADEIFFWTLMQVIVRYFKDNIITPRELMMDYMQMIHDMRREGVYFQEHGKYSCKNEHEAYLKVYSKPEVMDYYMNALLISQLIWPHHFKMLRYFANSIRERMPRRILDVGAGHGLFSLLVRNRTERGAMIDIVDISEISLRMTNMVVGSIRANYIKTDIDEFIPNEKYDLIILGEILEHLDNPLSLLRRMKDILNDGGEIFITVPTNAPAIDHVYLFRNANEVFTMIESCGLSSYMGHVEKADAQTELIGIFCRE